MASPLAVSDSLGVALGEGAGLVVFGSASAAEPASVLALGLGVGDATKFGSAGTGVSVGDGDELAFLVFLQNVAEYAEF